jgi:ribosome-binding protein aMBF1 (putative translation factor)
VGTARHDLAGDVEPGQLTEMSSTNAEVRRRALADPEVRAAYQENLFAHQVALAVMRYRAEQGISQRQLAEMLEMPQSNVARLESGEHEPKVGK